MYAFHFTHIENLESILKNGLLSTNAKLGLGVTHENIANNNIQYTRSRIIIDNDLNLRSLDYIWDEDEIKYRLHDFVPFYFAYKCPMLFQVLTSKNIDEDEIIFFVIDVKKCLSELKSTYFSSASINRIENLPKLYNRDADLDNLNWDEITNLKGVGSDTLKQQRMAELLIYDRLPLNYIDHIIVWNERIKKRLTNIYNKQSIPTPKIDFSKRGHHYYCEHDPIFGGEKWGLPAILGPKYLLMYKIQYYQQTIKNQKINKIKKLHTFKYKNLHHFYEDLLKNPDNVIEVSEAYKTVMYYGNHASTIKEHSNNVHNNLFDLIEFQYLDEDNQLIAQVSCLLHDIGKGPASRWPDNTMMKRDYNHSARSLPMLERILSEEIEDISEDEISKIFLCVTYDDLIGEIVGNGRNKQQLFDITESSDEVNLLFAVGKADMKDVYEPWLEEHEDALNDLYNEAIAEIDENA
ncbi:DarT ssDNA thymidine ADP-ribosyltransferase family protein [Acinetobacter sp. Tr-809]|uniref:DarT ssDNA thymidine ADP-ribosyltransferase family protein n=1 Tax=Acinetobacter sp. Tr-809 TaxID=2608324 RepID=UPI0014239AAF|nr:DarT ssDNA thymidine ADP-ribosyltransferase family protein [Acinetobacter sp. Tr-809]